MEILSLVIAILFFIAGLIGVVLPILPGTILIFAGMIVYGLLAGFENLDLYFFIVQGIAAGLIFFVDHIAAAIGTRKFGGSNKASTGAVIGLILGTLLLGPLGFILGAFTGAFLAEIISGKPAGMAFKTGAGALIGFIGSAIIKVFISLAMIVWFFIRIW